MSTAGKKNEHIQSLKSGYTKPVRIFEVISIFTYIFTAGWVFWEHHQQIIDNPLLTLATVVVTWVVADLLTGILHWIFDTWGKYDWPFLGKFFVRPFLEHHISPNEITEHDWVETNGSNMFTGLAFLSIFLVAGAPPEWIIFALFISFWGGMTNQFHKWSHQTTVPFWVAGLQKTGIILSAENHKHHHRDEYVEHYCITNGVLNRILDKIAFFRLLEWSIQKITGKKPRDNELP